MWPVDVHLGMRGTHYSYASNFIWMTLPPGQGLALSPSIPFLHFFISQFPSFIFSIRIAPTQGRPAILSCSCVQNYHNSYNHFFLPPTPPLGFISEWAMQKIKNCNPQKSRSCTLSQNLLPGVKPISLCEANKQASFFKAALMHESELVNCETTPSQSGLERTAETGTHTPTHTLIWTLFEKKIKICGSCGDTGSRPVLRERCHARPKRER